VEREEGKNRMLLARLKQQGVWDDDTICSDGNADPPAAAIKPDTAAPLPDVAALPALRNVPRMLNLGSSFESSSLNSSISSSGGMSSSYYQAASPTSSVQARKGSWQGASARLGRTSRPGTADHQLDNLASTPSPPLADSQDQVSFKRMHTYLAIAINRNFVGFGVSYQVWQ